MQGKITNLLGEFLFSVVSKWKNRQRIVTLSVGTEKIAVNYGQYTANKATVWDYR